MFYPYRLPVTFEAGATRMVECRSNRSYEPEAAAFKKVVLYLKVLSRKCVVTPSRGCNENLLGIPDVPFSN
jgi:hypothetical protein